MILDIRYHIASLVAVFLALGLGILIGASILDEGRLIESQEQLIAGLERRFDSLQGERNLLEAKIALLKTELEEQNSLLAALETPLVEGALEGKTVTLVYGSPEWQEYYQMAINELLLQSGAEVVGKELLTEFLPISVDLSLSGGESALDDASKSPVSIDNFPLELRALVKGDGGLLSGRRPAGQALKDRADMLVLVGPGGEHTAPWEKKLIEEAALMGMPVAVVGTQDMEGVLTEFATIGALAIDSLDSVVGRVGLIRGLLWGSSGYYGSGKEAVGLLPQPQR